MILSIQQPEFFPWLGYFDKFRQVDQVVILDNVQFKKRYFENRNRIRGGGDWFWIRVPVKVKGRFAQMIADVAIDESQNWRATLARSLHHAYGKAPYWASHGAPLADLVASWPGDRLADLNIAVIAWLAERLGVRRPMVRARDLGVDGTGSQLILDLCRHQGADIYLSGAFGRDYLDLDAFAAAGIAVRFQAFKPFPYAQFQGDPFLPGMSAVDLLVNHGPAAPGMLAEQATGSQADTTEGVRA